jgi:hypothetical protein
LSSVKLAGRSEVTVVWAKALPPENANVVSRTAAMEAANRCEDIMTYLARVPQNRRPALWQTFARTLEVTRQNRPGSSCGIVHRSGNKNRHEGERSA